MPVLAGRIVRLEPLARARGAPLARLGRPDDRGPTFDGVRRKHLLVPGGERFDSAWWSVLDDESPAAPDHLESRLAARVTDAATLRSPGIPQRNWSEEWSTP
ncbi:MAG TPA: hypothetical protein VFG70_02235 [Gaiellaceae bacterium]|nr:hypothetical protein [Gaiellaceae bacterium]